jgi:7tm Odorant receptor
MAINWMEPFDKITKVLKISGLWLQKSSPKCLITVAVLMHFLFLEVFVIFGIVYLVNFKNIEDFSVALGVVALLFVASIKSIYFVANKNKIQSMMKGLKELIEHETWIEKQNGGKLKKRIRQIYIISRMFVAVSMTSVFIGSLVPFFAHQLPLKMWFPYDYNNNDTLFWLIVAYQTIASCCFVPVMVVFEMIPVYFMSYLTGIIEELSDRMGKICYVKIVKVEPKSDLNENEKLVGRLKVATMRKSQVKVESKPGTSQMKDKNQEELLKCIEIQQKIKGLVTEVNDVFGSMIWFHGFISSFVLCVISFTLTIVSLKALRIHAKLKFSFL